jgi:hypothetical protein
MFFSLEINAKCRPLDTADAVGALVVYALGSNTAFATLLHLFAVLNENVLEQMLVRKFLSLASLRVTRMLMSSQIGQIRHPRTCVSLLYCRKFTCSHIHMLTEKNSRE